MIDRSVGALAFAFCLLLAQTCLNLFFLERPKLILAALALGFVCFIALWGRAAIVIVLKWGDLSARVVRYASIGALLLTLWPVTMLFLITFLPSPSE